MICYASNTGTLRNLAALRAHGWRILLTPKNPKPPAGFRCAVDNGAWTAYCQNQPLDAEGFMRLVEQYGPAADFVVIPDKVAKGAESLEYSILWLERLRHLRLVLLPVQDGMDPAAVGAIIRRTPNMGIFLGGSTEWKLKTMYGMGNGGSCAGLLLPCGPSQHYAPNQTMPRSRRGFDRRNKRNGLQRHTSDARRSKPATFTLDASQDASC